MSLAFATLSELGATIDAMRRLPTLPAIPSCVKQANALSYHDKPKPRPTDAVLEALRQELQVACNGAGADSLNPKTLRHAPLVLWHGQPPAAAFRGLLQTFLETAAARPSWLRQLIEAWLRDFGTDQIALPQVGAAISGLLRQALHPRLKAWQDAHERYQIFDATEGPRRVGRALLRGPGEVAQVLTHTGMDEPLRADGEFFRASLRSLLGDLPDALQGPTAPAAWARAVSVLEIQATKADWRGNITTRSSLRFGDKQSGETARACLAPWLMGREPPNAPRKEIMAFLLRHIGDPRFQESKWKDLAGDEATRLMRRWLSEASLEAFLALISQSNDDRQWHYRQAFWRACLRKMPAAEVWVVLGPGLASRAGAVRDLHGSFGKLEGSADQAVLLMRMNSLVLSEWSNVGPVRAWDVVDKRCPKLYRSTYSIHELRAPCLDFPDHPTRGNGGSSDGRGLWHRGGEHGLWQGCAAALLFNKLGVRLSPADYMPR